MVPICAGRCVRLHFPDNGSKSNRDHSCRLCSPAYV